MEHLLGLLKVRVVRGVNLASRDVRGSDPYVVLRMGNQKLKTHVKKNNVNPEWNEDLTLSVADPSLPVKLEVFDKDLFSKDDKMGDAEFVIRPIVEAGRLDPRDIPNGSIIRIMTPSNQNSFVRESVIASRDGKIVQDMVLRLKNVECGEVELQLQWVSLPGKQGL